MRTIIDIVANIAFELAAKLSSIEVAANLEIQPMTFPTISDLIAEPIVMIVVIVIIVVLITTSNTHSSNDNSNNH